MARVAKYGAKSPLVTCTVDRIELAGPEVLSALAGDMSTCLPAAARRLELNIIISIKSVFDREDLSMTLCVAGKLNYNISTSILKSILLIESRAVKTVFTPQPLAR